MSSKKSKLKPQWITDQDGVGYVLMLSRQNSDSMNESALNNEVNMNMKKPTISPSGLLTVQITKMKEKDFKLTDSLKNSIIELNPETMQVCEMRLGGPVLVTSSDSTTRQIALRVWPSMSVPLGKVSMCDKLMKNLKLEEDDFVSMLGSQSVCASSITINFLSENDSDLDSTIVQSSYFSKYLQQILDLRYLVPGQHVDVEYFGRILHLFMVSVEPGEEFQESMEESSTNISGLSQLQDSLVNLSLQSSGDAAEDYSPLSKPNARKKLSNSNDLTSTPKQTASYKPCFSPPNNVNVPTDDRRRQQNTTCNRLTSNSDCVVFQINKFTKISIVDPKEACQGDGGQVGSNDSEYFGLYSYNNIGGLQEQIKILKEMIDLPISRPELFKKSGLAPPSGVLLHGPPGTGKSLLMKACVNETGVNAMLLQGASILSRYFGDSEQKLKDLFDKAREQAPSIILIDEIDAICPQRDVTRSDVEKRLVSSFITLLDGVTAANHCTSKYVVVLATTNRIEALDPALRRAGRFDREIEIPIPSPDDRIAIFHKLLVSMKHKLQNEDISSLAEKAHGYVGADIAAVCKEAGMRALRSMLDVSCGEKEEEIIVSLLDFEYGLKQVPPSAMRELIVQVPKVLWSDIGGNVEVKKKLKQAIEWPLKNPEAFQRLGIEPPRGVLLYGPPGCSKTLTARALATESGLNFISIKGPELFSKYVGDSERAIRRIFSKARSAAPSIVFFDELDALAIERGGGSSKGGGNVADRVLAAMLTEMDGVEQRRDVIVVAATNRPDMIDKALMRPGRIDRIVHVPLPDAATRSDILRLQFRKTPISSDVDLEWLVQKTEKYSGAEICAVCREAALSALDDDMGAMELTSRDFEFALSVVLPQTTDAQVSMYEEYSRTLQSTIK